MREGTQAGAPFPFIACIDDVLPAIAGFKEFFVSERNGYTAIDYHYRTDETFGRLPGASAEAIANARLRRECRGIKFDRASGDLICRPLHKFFNLGELGEFAPHEVDWSRAHHVLDKLDGSMIAPARVQGEIRYMTRVSDRDVAAQADVFAHNHGSIPYDTFVGALLDWGMTPVFEWCSRQQRIVIDYPDDMLVLTAIRHRQSGEYVAYDEMAAMARADGIPIVKAWDQTVSSTGDFVAHVRGMTDSEGYVVRFPSGAMVKLKADDYVARHSALSDLTSERKVLKLVLADLDDDFLQLLDAPRARRLETFARDIRRALGVEADTLERTVDSGKSAVDGDRKRFALEVIPAIPKVLQGAAFSVLDGKPARQALADVLDKASNHPDTMERVRFLMGGASWAADEIDIGE